ncbi:hypothetical protein N5P37_009081 [Trichoderma harzianum]|uniref:Uncharacterized protein n=1 Tax=Trichoderma harzianum CBS 226.95 TaxID=983964 RepID=A0A2T4A673_TRIHA|nr:hypothetical protein M431DRAFT_496863 [Trichoderma harzianum CBS 226.95]KAK0758682.1 hypothetical protein N5P37_009081 [Trichoderma harzianum]PTB52536.1 hypothetical protein M431DRAFT_496863 [Trichoderma harzianum CBS 226.95]
MDQKYSQMDPPRHQDAVYHQYDGQYGGQAIDQTLPPTDQEEALFLEQVTGWIPRQPPAREARMFRLSRPVVIPRVDIARPFQTPFPFMRAYSPDLYRHDISAETFVAFIDNLAVAEAPPAPLQALNVAGQAIGFVPHHWAQAASFGIGMAAGVGTAAVTRIRTQRFLEAVNRDYFGPRGLKVSICKGHDLAPRIGLGQLLPEIPDRQMQSIAANIAPLSLDVPPPSEQRNIIDRLSAKQVESQIKKSEKSNRKELLKLREKDSKMARRSQGHSGGDSSDSSWEDEQRELDEKMQKIQRKADEKLADASPRQASRIEERRAKEMRKIEREQRKLDKEVEKKMSKASRKEDKKLSKDGRKAGRMEFVVVENI